TYDNMDAVPPEQRERVQTIRDSLTHGGSLLDKLQNAGIDTANLPDEARKAFGISAGIQANSAFDSKATHFDHDINAPDFEDDIEALDFEHHAPNFEHHIDEPIIYDPSNTLSPGAVPSGR